MMFYHTVHLYKTFKNGDLKEFFNTFKICLTMYSLNFKSFWFIAKISTLQPMLIDLKILIDLGGIHTKNRVKLEYAISKITKVIKLFFFTAFVSIIIPCVMSLINYNKKVLTYETWTYWDYKTNEVVYWIAQVNQITTVFYGVSVNYGTDLMPIIFTALLIGLLQELAENIESVSYEDDKKFQDCINRHIKIKELVNNVSSCLSTIILLQSILSTFILCASVILLTTVRF